MRWSRHNIEVWRGGAKGEIIKPQQIEHSAITSGLPVDDVPFSADGVTIQFTLAGEYRGSTYDVWIGAGSFARLASAMIKASPKTAEQAFLSAMLEVRKKDS